ncbi:MAG: mechanosensitive ion channel family protein [Pseudomonadales bacterium]|nr:mechanosensitive ion channel family protein [Pseudomonadales bacterium]
MPELTLDPQFLLQVAKAFLIVFLGWLLVRLLLRVSRSFLQSRLDRHQAVLMERLIFWGLMALFIMSALKQVGFDLGILLGAAGILTVAVGFASQTSAANIISGLFIVGERSVSVGDVIKVGTYTGEILSVDWLSIKLRTFDNLFVRIPNESFIKSEVINLSKFPIRRFDLQVGIAYHEDIGHARTVLMQVADRNPLCLDNPEPLIIMQGFGESSIDMQFSVWTLKENYLQMRNSIYEDIKHAFDNAGIDIPFPHRTLYVGEKTIPMPVDVRGNP